MKSRCSTVWVLAVSKSKSDCCNNGADTHAVIEGDSKLRSVHGHMLRAFEERRRCTAPLVTIPDLWTREDKTVTREVMSHASAHAADEHTNVLSFKTATHSGCQQLAINIDNSKRARTEGG